MEEKELYHLIQTLSKNNISSGFLKDMIIFLLRNDQEIRKEIIDIIKHGADGNRLSEQ